MKRMRQLGLAFATVALGTVFSLTGCDHSGTVANERSSNPQTATITPKSTATVENPEKGDSTLKSGAEELPVTSKNETDNVAQKIADAVATKSAVDANGNPVVLPVKALPGGVKVLIPKKEFAVEGPDNAVRISYDDIDLLKVINMEPVTPDAPKYFPEWLKDLEGKRVRVRGFMYPEFEPTGLEMFSLARDTQICCFGRDPKVYDVFRVILKEGVTTDYIELKPFDVIGTFHIDPVELGGDLVQMYYIDDAVIVRK
ncbi:MAG: hypothetical protein O2955_06175 [Planctomycetota bacterium]|nr:hypothetical protein [Planctomycetota bacterium]MDA1212081.1 hypothetical protein [Planctomycetota bacterium]